MNTAFHAASQDVYNATQGAQGGAQQANPTDASQQGGSSNAQGDNVQDADFEEVK